MFAPYALTLSTITAGILFKQYTLRRAAVLFPTAASYKSNARYCGQTIIVTASNGNYIVERSLEGVTIFYDRQSAFDAVFGDSLVTSDISIIGGGLWGVIAIVSCKM